MNKGGVLKKLATCGKMLLSRNKKPTSFIDQIEAQYRDPSKRVVLLRAVNEVFYLDKESERALVHKLIEHLCALPKYRNGEPYRVLTFIEALHQAASKSIFGNDGLEVLLKEIKTLPKDKQPEMFIRAASWAHSKSHMESRPLNEYDQLAVKLPVQERIEFYKNTCDSIAESIADNDSPNGPRILNKIKNKINVLNQSSATRPDETAERPSAMRIPANV